MWFGWQLIYFLILSIRIILDQLLVNPLQTGHIRGQMIFDIPLNCLWIALMNHFCYMLCHLFKIILLINFTNKNTNQIIHSNIKKSVIYHYLVLATMKSFGIYFVPHQSYRVGLEHLAFRKIVLYLAMEYFSEHQLVIFLLD